MKRTWARRLALIAALVLALLPGVTIAGPPAPTAIGVGPTELPDTAGAAIPGRLLVKYRPSTLPASAGAALAAPGLQLQSRPLTGRWVVAEFDPHEDLDTKRGLVKALPFVEAVELDYVDRIMVTPDDANYPFQWNFPQVQAEQVWNSTTGAGVIVAVLDTGLRADHAEAPANIVVGYNGLDGSSNTVDDNGHGTHVTGTIAQRTNNATGTAGLAYNATIMPVKVCDAGGSCPISAQIDGINFAVANGAKVINMSLGGSTNSAARATAISDAEAAGVTVVAAMGNTGNGSIRYPAANDGVIAVGATRFDQARSYYSTFGNHIWVTAPGGDTTVDQNGDGYGDGVLQLTLGSTCGNPDVFAYCFLQGTSMATPHVTATVALLKAAAPSLTESQIRTILRDSAKDLGPAGWDAEYGHGLIQAADAVAMIFSVYPPQAYAAISMRTSTGPW